MSETKVWNLGEIADPAEPEVRTVVRPRPVTAAAPRRPVSAAASAPAGASLRELLPSCCSLFVPGSGQLFLGEPARGLFFVSAVGFLAALGWALFDSLERLRSTALLLDWPRELGVWMLGGIYVAAALVHLAGVAGAAGSTRGRGLDTHAAVPAVASLLIPGWGQLLNGHRWRAVGFLLGLWTVGAAWLFVSQPAVALLDGQGLFLPRGFELFASPAVRWTLPAVIWTLSVYDAFTGAERRRG